MKKGKITMAIAAFSICVGLSGVHTFAKVNSILINDTTAQKIYEYNYNDLSDSFESAMLGDSSPLYNDYSSKMSKLGVYAIYDDTNKFVDFAQTEAAFEDAQLNTTPFDINAFTESSNAPLLKTTPTTVYDVQVSGNSVNYVSKNVGGGTTPTNPDSSDFSVISIE